MNEQTLSRLLALLILAPLWLPVLKALYSDFQGALWEEGGLLGRPPGKRDLEKLREVYGDYESPLVNEPHESRRFRDRSSERAKSPSDGRQRRF